MKVTEDTSESLEFDINDVEKNFNLRKGDKVEFNIAIVKQTKAKKATNIVLLRETGTIEGIKNSYGFITFDGMNEKNPDDRLFFHESEVEKGVTLQPGDVVEFLRVYNPRTKAMNAIEIKRLKEAPPSTKKPQLNINRVPEQKIVAIRQPKSADWTQPFAGGRGKLLPEEKNKLLAAFLANASSSSPSTPHIQNHNETINGFVDSK